MLPLLLSVALVGGCSTRPFLGARMLFVLVPLAVLGRSGDVFYVLSMERDLGFSLVVLRLCGISFGGEIFGDERGAVLCGF